MIDNFNFRVQSLLVVLIAALNFSCLAKSQQAVSQDETTSISALLTLMLDITICEAENPNLSEISKQKHDTVEKNLALVKQQTNKRYGKGTYLNIEKDVLNRISGIATQRRAQHYYNDSFCRNFLQQNNKKSHRSFK